MTRLRYFEDKGFQKLLTRLGQLAAPQPKLVEEPGQSGGHEPQVTEPTVEYVHYRQVRVPYEKAWLADEGDVDSFLESMREALIADIKKGKRIQV